MIENKNIKDKTDRDLSKLKVNRVVVESYINTQKKNISNNSSPNTTNINNEILNIQNKDNNVTPGRGPSYSICNENDINLSYHIKSFNLPLSIVNTFFNYLTSIPKKENNDTNNTISFRKNYVITRSNIFIGARQNLKGMNLHLIENKKYNNVTHKEITDLKNNNKRGVEKVEINLSQSKNANILSPTEEINNETIAINKKKYINELVNKINITSNTNKNNTQQYYILIKQDRKSKNNKFIHEVISPETNKDLETSVYKFLNDNQENVEYNMDTLNKRTSQNNIIVNSGKKKSKFNNKSNEISMKNSEEINNDNSNSNNDIQPKEEFCPVFIFTQEQIENLLKNVEKKTNKKKDKVIYSINNITSLNFEKTQKTEILKNSKQEKLTDLNFNLYPVKVDKFQFIPTNTNNLGGGGVSNNLLLNLNMNIKDNIDVSNIALNQSDDNYTKQKMESDYSLQKIKETEDFSQCTPISLLQEKYFLYAVSKWAKYSVVNPQTQIYIKYNHKSGHPKFDPILLDMTNFTIWIEKIHTKKDSKKSIVTSNSNNIYTNSKNTKIGYTKSKSYKTGAAIFLNETNNLNEGNNQIKKKKSKSKPKLDKKK